MSTQVQFRRGTTIETASFTGAVGEVTVDTSKDTCVVHDGAKAGGYPLLREDGTNIALSLGTKTTCAIKFAGDSGTGMYSPGLGQLGFAVGGIDAIRIDSSGAITIPGNVSIAGGLTVAGAFNSTDNLALIVALG
jgi:hypothetical protein